jgi:hypothetical protein
MDEDIKYTIIYNKTADTEIYYHAMFEDIRGFLLGMKEDEILEIDKRIQNCLCGGKAELHEFEGMGTVDYVIRCKECIRTMERTPYDVDVKNGEEVLELCIRDWNAGLSKEDIKRMNDMEHERIRLREEDFIWKDLYPNNMKCNGIEGCYSLLYKITKDKIKCCKWTIGYQEEEIKPGLGSFDSPIEAYNLFVNDYELQEGKLGYPKPTENSSWELEEDADRNVDVNDYGRFVRSYKTLEEAKLGAIVRSGRYGMNRDTILREIDYHDKTVEEVIYERKLI